MKSSNHTLNLHSLFSCTLLYSSSLLLACCTPAAYCCTPADNCLLTHSLPASSESALMKTAWTLHTENTCHVTLYCCVTSQRMGQLRGQKENTSHDRYLLLCDSPRTQSKHSFPYCFVLEHVYGAVVWKWVFTLQYVVSQ
jgi:hypothetical protein